MPGLPVAVDQPPCPVRPSGWPVDPGPTYLGDRKEKSNIHLQVSNKNSSSYIISNWSTHPSRRASDHQSRFPFPPSPSPFTEITASAGLSSLLICIVWFPPPFPPIQRERRPKQTNEPNRFIAMPKGTAASPATSRIGENQAFLQEQKRKALELLEVSRSVAVLEYQQGLQVQAGRVLCMIILIRSLQGSSRLTLVVGLGQGHAGFQ